MIVVDDHLLRQLLVRRPPPDLSLFLDDHVVATTSLYYARLCRRVAAAPHRMDRISDLWTSETRFALARALAQLPDEILITPMRELAWRMGRVVNEHRVSLLGAEAVVAAAHLDAPLCVASTDDGPGIQAAAEAMGVPYVVIAAA